MPSPAERLKGNGEVILVVDDEANQRDIACAILGQLEYRTACASSGEKATAWLENHAADLVVIDMFLGRGLNGREAYERFLKSADARLAKGKSLWLQCTQPDG